MLVKQKEVDVEVHVAEVAGNVNAYMTSIKYTLVAGSRQKSKKVLVIEQKLIVRLL